MPTRTLPLSFNARGALVKKLQDNLETLGYAIPKHEVETKVFGAATREALLSFQSDHRLLKTGALDEATGTALEQAVLAVSAEQYHVQGRIVFDYRRPADNLTIRVYNRSFGDRQGILLGETKTDEQGYYSVSYDPKERAANLEIRAVDANGKEISLSTTKYNAAKHESLNLVAPGTIRQRPSEFEELKVALEKEVGRLNKLAEARENDERQDITLLHNATGWDARAIALLALAVRANAKTRLPLDAMYAMFRAGLPTDVSELVRISPDSVEKALIAARDASVVQLKDEQIAKVKTAFDRYSRQARRETPLPGRLSSFAALIDISGLNDREKVIYEDIAMTHTGGAVTFWQKVRDTGLPEEKVQTLRIQARLGDLTFNNVSLIRSLQRKLVFSDDDLSALAYADYYKADKWGPELDALVAGTDDPDVNRVIPPAYTGENGTERRNAYAEDMARKIRLNYPTQVVTRMIEKKELNLGEGHDETMPLVTRFLKKAVKRGFKLGQVPVNPFIEEHHDALFSEHTPEEIETTIQEVKKLYRLYQITPSDESLVALYNAGITAAHDFEDYDYAQFKMTFGSLLPSELETTLVYRKAQQVNTVTDTLQLSIEKAAATPSFYVTAGSLDKQVESAKKLNDWLKGYANMETLFGSLDFCECEHCRSVLSPAAYFVDLLHFLDTASKSADGQTPYDVLTARRPDLPHLPLTCENTNTVMPYIDIVNEILEYYVANGTLDKEAGKDTGDVASAELLAEPQHVIEKAYETLKLANYPLSLPFDLWLETARMFFNHFEMPLWKVMEFFHPPKGDDDKLSEHKDIFIESLGITPSEYDIFIYKIPENPPSVSKKNFWHLLYGYTVGVSAVSILKSAKTLSRRLGVKYKELVALMRVSFINPELEKFPELLKTPATVNLNDSKYKNVLVLFDPPDAGCNFDKTTLQYADGRSAEDIDFLRLNLFVRLWKKLGWTMEETDRALMTFLPEKPDVLKLATIGKSFEIALIYLSHLKTLDAQVKVGRNSRLKLLTLWDDLPIGKNSLYAQLFLNHSILKSDPVFDDPEGNYLTNSAETIEKHLPALQGALTLTDDEIKLILADNKKDVSDQLSLANVSLLYRYKLLAKAIGLSVKDMIALKELSGLNPFKKLDPPLELDEAYLADDYPFSQTLRFVEVATKVKESGFSVEDLVYLLHHRFDPVGKYRFDREAIHTLIRTLATGIRNIAAENAIPDNPANFTNEILRQKLTLIFQPDVVETFMTMWLGTISYEYSPVDVAESDALTPDLYKSVHEIEIRFVQLPNNTTQKRVIYKGVLHKDRQAVLVAQFPELKNALQSFHQNARQFFEDHFVPNSVSQKTVSFSSTDFDDLFDPAKEGSEKRGKLASVLLPFLEYRLTSQFIVQSLSSATGTEPDLLEALITTDKLLHEPGNDTGTLLDAFTAIGESGVDVRFEKSGGGASEESSLPTAKISIKPEQGVVNVRIAGCLEVPAAGSYRFLAKLDQPNAKAELRFDHQTTNLDLGGPVDVELKPGLIYRFTLAAHNMTEGDLELLVQGENRPKGALNQLTLYRNPAIERFRRASVLLTKVLQIIQTYKLSVRDALYLLDSDKGKVDLKELPAKEADLSPEEVEKLQGRFKQFLKLAEYGELKRTLSADNDDLITVIENYSRSYPEDAYQQVDSSDEGDKKRVTEIHLEPLMRLLRRNDAEAITELLGKDTGVGITVDLVQNPDQRGYTVTIGELASPATIQRIWEGLQLVTKFGVPISKIKEWAAPAPNYDVESAGQVKNAIRSRYEPETWQRIAQPIFDKLRQRQRDALVAYIMHQEQIDQPEKLFEMFLIDPGMEPVVQTSRLRLAISSVQTFVQRCLLNLEPDVSPAAVDAEKWKWMRRYRVWEANRKIFLFPENWLEPEFRDEKSYMFQELEGALLQGDVSRELVEDALFTYLQKLSEIEKLEIITIYKETKGDPAKDVLHVIGRTGNDPKKYFYRRHENNRWTPWEPVTTEIEGDHIVAAVWNQRLHLFWVTFMPKQADNATGDTFAERFNKKTINETVNNQVTLQLHWSKYYQGQWTARTSSAASLPIQVGPEFENKKKEIAIYSVKTHIAIDANDSNGEFSIEYIQVNLDFTPFVSGNQVTLSAYINLETLGAVKKEPIQSFLLKNKNYPPVELEFGDSVSVPFFLDLVVNATQYDAPKFSEGGELQRSFLEVSFNERTGELSQSAGDRKRVIASVNPFSLVIGNPVQDIQSEFFVQDSEHVFYVKPEIETKLDKPPLFQYTPEFDRTPDIRRTKDIEPNGPWMKWGQKIEGPFETYYEGRLITETGSSHL